MKDPVSDAIDFQLLPREVYVQAILATLSERLPVGDRWAACVRIGTFHRMSCPAQIESHSTFVGWAIESSAMRLSPLESALFVACIVAIVTVVWWGIKILAA
jgi:hypothetical protein